MNFKHFCNGVAELSDSNRLIMNPEFVMLVIFAKFGHLGSLPKCALNHQFYKTNSRFWQTYSNMSKDAVCQLIESNQPKINTAYQYLSAKITELRLLAHQP